MESKLFHSVYDLFHEDEYIPPHGSVSPLYCVSKMCDKSWSSPQYCLLLSIKLNKPLECVCIRSKVMFQLKRLPFKRPVEQLKFNFDYE